MSGFKPEEYNTVAERLIAFYDKFPDGSIQSEVLELTDKRVVMRGIAYRSKDDDKPGIGTSAMPIPATNAMLRNSEIETAETSAWGRAIAALGFEVRKAVATKDEVDNKRVTVEAHTDGLIGTAEVGKARDSDFELRKSGDDEHFALGFKLKSNGGGFKVLTRDELALQLLDVKDEVVGKRVTVFGRVRDEEYTPKGTGRKVVYQVIDAERIKTEAGTLPVMPKREEVDREAAIQEIYDSLPDVIPVAEGQEALFDQAESDRLDREAAAAG
jgi:hypothetical protein